MHIQALATIRVH